jgi:hypothetical protein
MKTLSLFVEPPGTTATMKTQPNDDVVTYIVFVRKWLSTGPVPETTWHPDQLESAAGASIVLDPTRGYDFILKAEVRPKSMAAMSVDLQMGAPGAGAFTKPVALPNSEGPVVEREWKVILR